MSVYDRLAANRDLDQFQGAWYATIAETATSLNQRVPVVLPDFNDLLQFGPCRWSPRVKTATVNVAETGEDENDIIVSELVMPTRGDECLVLFDNRQIPWIIEWWPA